MYIDVFDNKFSRTMRAELKNLFKIEKKKKKVRKRTGQCERHKNREDHNNNAALKEIKLSS